MTQLSLSPQKLCRLLACIAAGFALLNLVTQFLHYRVGGTLVDVVAGQFDLDGEANIPSWFSSSLLLVCAALLQLIALARRTAHDADRAYWQGLAIIFLVISLDETASLRRFPTWVLHSRLHTSGPFLYAWVLPAMALIVLLGLSYLRFLLRLPRPVRFLCFLAAGLYVSGALGLEMVEGFVSTNYGQNRFAFQWIVTAEEYGEMIGATLFLWALLLYLGSEIGPIDLRVDREPQPIPLAGRKEADTLPRREPQESPPAARVSPSLRSGNGL